MSRKQRRTAQQHPNRPSVSPAGPRTPEGKAVSSQNAFSHGLTAARLVLPWEDADEFDALLNQLIAEHQPATATEGILVREMAEQYWRLQRARNHEYSLLVQTPEILEGSAGNPALYPSWEKGVTLAQRYATRHERAFHRCLATLRTLQKERRIAQAQAEAEADAQAKTPNEEATPSAPREFVSQNQKISGFDPQTGSRPPQIPQLSTSAGVA